MISKEYSWFNRWWEEAGGIFSRRPSAILFHGPAGIGKTDFGREVAAAWLCKSPLADGSACGVCDSCGWFKAGQHPDFRWVRPDAEVEEEGGSEADSAGASDTEGSSDPKKKSQQIRISQIRELAAFANIGSHRGGLRVVLISPANRMNFDAANALLKTLEEPADALVFLLVADSLMHIPATILSRCRRVALTIEDESLAKIQTEKSQAAPWLIELLEEISDRGVDPIRWAEKAGKSPPADALELLMRWMADADRVRLGLKPRAFPEKARALKDQSLRIKSAQSWTQTIAELQRLRAIAEHPLNPKLFYESIFDRLRRAIV